MIGTDSLSGELRKSLARLHRAIHEDRKSVVPVIGSGLSLPIPPKPRGERLPSWPEMIDDLCKEIRDPDSRQTLRLLGESGRHWELAKRLGSMLDRSVVQTYVKDHFKSPRFEAPSIYASLARLPLDHYLTTNFDPFLVKAIANRGDGSVPDVKVPKDTDALHNLGVDSPPFVFMLHGSAARPATCLVFPDDLQNEIQRNLAYANSLVSLASQRTLVFVGHSASDVDLDWILTQWQAVTGSQELRHWLLAAGLDRTREPELRARGIRCVEYGGAGEFEKLEAVISHLASPPVPERVELRFESPALPTVESGSRESPTRAPSALTSPGEKAETRPRVSHRRAAIAIVAATVVLVALIVLASELIPPPTLDPTDAAWAEVERLVKEDAALRDFYDGTPIHRRDDFLPLVEDQSERRLLHFMVLGTGEKPTWDPLDDRWRIDGESAMVAVLLPAGEFVMGAQRTDPAGPNYDPQAQHDESIRQERVAAFYIAAHECTAGQFNRIRGESFHSSTALPRNGVSWGDAGSAASRIGGRLPSEEEWEYACRAGTKWPYFFANPNDLVKYAWFGQGPLNGPFKVGQKAANPWELHDMQGNVWEWCSNDNSLANAPRGSRRALRGASFLNEADQCRSACRQSGAPDSRQRTVGFRVAWPATAR